MQIKIYQLFVLYIAVLTSNLLGSEALYIARFRIIRFMLVLVWLRGHAVNHRTRFSIKK